MWIQDTGYLEIWAWLIWKAVLKGNVLLDGLWRGEGNAWWEEKKTDEKIPKANLSELCVPTKGFGKSPSHSWLVVSCFNSLCLWETISDKPDLTWLTLEPHSHCGDPVFDCLGVTGMADRQVGTRRGGQRGWSRVSALCSAPGAAAAPQTGSYTLRAFLTPQHVDLQAFLYHTLAVWAYDVTEGLWSHFLIQR